MAPFDRSLQDRASDVAGVDLATKMPTQVLKLSEDLYSLFIAEPLQLDVQVDGRLITVIEMVRLVCFLCVSLVLQLVLISQLHKITEHQKGSQCEHEHPYVQLTCVGVFVTSTAQELRHTLGLGLLLWRSPTVTKEGYEQLRQSSDHNTHGAVLQVEDKSHHGFSGFLKGRIHGSDHDEGGGLKASPNWTLKAMTIPWKVTCLLCTFLPRLTINLLLIKQGTGFIVTSGLYGLILHTVNTLFVLSVQSVMFAAFTSKDVKDKLAKTKGIEHVPTMSELLINYVASHILYPMMVIVVTVYTVWSARLTCPSGQTFADSLDKINWRSFAESCVLRTW